MNDTSQSQAAPTLPLSLTSPRRALPAGLRFLRVWCVYPSYFPDSPARCLSLRVPGPCQARSRPTWHTCQPCLSRFHFKPDTCTGRACRAPRLAKAACPARPSQSPDWPAGGQRAHRRGFAARRGRSGPRPTLPLGPKGAAGQSLSRGPVLSGVTRAGSVAGIRPGRPSPSVPAAPDQSQCRTGVRRRESVSPARGLRPSGAEGRLSLCRRS